MSHPYEDRGPCPECGEFAISSCRCRIGNLRCANGHDWHKVDGKVVLGTGHHGEKTASVSSSALSPITIAAFADELEKIAGFQQNVGNAIVHTAKGAGNLVQKGWHESGNWWGMGQGRIARMLPGGKALTVGGSAMMLPGAVAKEDPTGQGRTRTERLAGLAGGTVAGLAGGASPNLAKSLIGGTAAGIGGEYIAGRAARVVSPRKKPVAQQPEQAPAQPAAAPAPAPVPQQ
jgi:hypothetical protein